MRIDENYWLGGGYLPSNSLNIYMYLEADGCARILSS